MEDSKAAGRWETAQGGEYFAVGVEGAVTGRGADLLIIDDPHSEQDAMSKKALDRAYEWYTTGPRQRLQPNGVIVLVMTRWNKGDLTGKLQSAQKEPKADQWEVVEFPAIMPSGKPVWPEYWDLEQLLSVKASVALPKWNAQYMQNPTSEEGALIKREWWKKWPEDRGIPKCDYVIQSYDTAYLKKETADFSAITTWGVFRENEDTKPNLLLLDEPTNHLDLEMRHALTLALQEYKGAMIVVSHDRHLLRSCVDELWLVSNGTVDTFDGNLADYQNLLSSADKTEKPDKKDNKTRLDAREERQRTAAKRAQVSPLKRKLESLELEIKAQQATLKDMEMQLAESDIYHEDKKESLQNLLQERGKIKKNLFEKEELWLECQEQLDAMKVDASL